MVLTNLLHKEIGAPRSPKIMVVPLISRGKVIAVTYADFGAKPVSPPQINLLEALAGHAGSILDNALYRKSLEKGI
jgi:GAF domain-containing protein